MRDKLSVIPGFDYDIALENSGGDEEILKVVVGEIAEECEDRIADMKKCLAEGNYKDYGYRL